MTATTRVSERVEEDGATVKSEIKPWGVTMVESHGDYREEAFLETRIGGPLYEFQPEMPQLPVPSIQATLERLLPSVLPLARTVEEEANFREACRKFPEQAQVLHERLVSRRNGEFKNSSWLQLWWNQVGIFLVCRSFASFFLLSSLIFTSSLDFRS